MSAIMNMNNQGAAAQVVRTIPHTIDNVDSNVLSEPGLVTVIDESETGDISVILWEDESAVVYSGSASFINSLQLVVKKVNLAGTSIDASKIKLFR